VAWRFWDGRISPAQATYGRNEIVRVLTLISVVIPVFNRAPTVGTAIASVLPQALPADAALEVIVVDDASTDDLAGALAPFGDRVRLLRHAGNAGAAAARNTAIATARGEFLAFLDSDDVWLPGKLMRQLAAMRAHGWQASCTAFELAHPGRGAIVAPRWPTGALALDRLVWGCFVSPGSTLLASRGVFATVGSFDAELERFEDWDWLMRLTAATPLGFLAEPLARIEPAGFSDTDKASRALARLERKHADALPPELRRGFLAGVEIERAATHFRRGERLKAAARVLRSLARVPLGNRALAAVLGNALARR
jgi:glycosyltransferase involved in cell wall biosynthesis